MVDAGGLRPGMKGYHPSPEHLAKMREGRAAAMAAKAGQKQAGKQARKGGKGPRPLAERPPSRTALVGAGAQKKVQDLVEFAIGGSEMVALWVLRQTVASEVRLAPNTTPEMLSPENRETYERIVAAHRKMREDLELDKLEEWERRYLAGALVSEAFNYPRLKAWLIKIADLADRTTLPMVVMLIALPRLVRHGVVPSELGDLLAGARESAKRANRPGSRKSVDESPPVEHNGSRPEKVGEYLVETPVRNGVGAQVGEDR